MRVSKEAYILVLPSLFTTGNLFCGFFSIVRSMNHEFLWASYAILLAGVFDVLDGRVARMTRSQTKFGVEYDSIADVVSFGIAPALLAYTWALSPFGRLGWAAAFFFAACGSLRLARFNAVSDKLPKSYFIGLPIPAAAFLLAAMVIAHDNLPGFYSPEIVLAVMFALGLLMVSSIRYRSFKDFDVRHRRSFFILVFIVGLIALIAVKPEITMVVVVAYYVAWGPLREMLSLCKARGKKIRNEKLSARLSHENKRREIEGGD